MLHNLLRALPTSRKRDWTACLPQLLYAYNITPYQSTGENVVQCIQWLKILGGVDSPNPVPVEGAFSEPHFISDN